MTDKFEKEGFEEYISVTGDGNDILILGKEMRVNEVVGVIGREGTMFAFFMKGNIAWQKIPTLINTLSEEDLFNVLAIQSERWD